MGSETCWCGKSIHYCDDGLADGKGRVACECPLGADHSEDQCPVCTGLERGDFHAQ